MTFKRISIQLFSFIFLQIFVFLVGNTEGFANLIPEISVNYRVNHPAASAAISQQYLNLPPIEKEKLFYNFETRVSSFRKDLIAEKSAAKLTFDAAFQKMRASYPGPSINQNINGLTTQLNALESETLGSGDLPASPIRTSYGYTLRAVAGQAHVQFTPLLHRLDYLSPGTASQANLKEFALLTLESADEAFASGRNEEGRLLFELAQDLANTTLQMRPDSNVGEHELQRRLLHESVYQNKLEGIQLTTARNTDEGMQIRSGFNVVFVAEHAAQRHCGAQAESPDCSQFFSHTQRIKTALLFSDQLSTSQDDRRSFQTLMGTVQPYLSALSGFSSAVLRGTITFSAGIAAAVFLPETVVVGATVGTIGYGVYRAIVAISESNDDVAGLLQARWGNFWNDFVDTTPHRQGEIVGEIITGAAGLLYGGRIAQFLNRGFTFTETATIDALGAGISEEINAARAMRSFAGATQIRIGENANQIEHAFRHTDLLGLDRAVVRDAVLNHARTIESQIALGSSMTQTIEVNGISLRYVAHRIAEGIINIGRITGPR